MAPQGHDFLCKRVPGNQKQVHTMWREGTLAHQEAARGGEAGAGLTAQGWPVGTASPGLQAPPSPALPLPPHGPGSTEKEDSQNKQALGPAFTVQTG